VKKIVVGIDGSDASKHALRWAVEEADARGARIVAVHAYDVQVPAPDAAPAPAIDLPGLVTEIHEGALRLVTSVVEEVVGEESDVEATAVDAPAAEALLEAARDADLLVVGSHGAGLAELLLGSVTLECVQHAPCPVLVHRRSGS
jgi:nucleotide-binding universal stress UspA family protein